MSAERAGPGVRGLVRSRPGAGTATHGAVSAGHGACPLVPLQLHGNCSKWAVGPRSGGGTQMAPQGPGGEGLPQAAATACVSFRSAHMSTLVPQC